MAVYKFSQPASGISLSAVTTGTGTAIAFNDCRQVMWFTEYSGTVSGGTILIECAPESDYAGTWYQLDSITAANISTGAEGAGTYPAPPGFWVRARISSNITGGGSVTVKLNGLFQ